MSIQETPILIRDETAVLYGVLRAPETWNSIMVLVPAPTGTRIGPQNIYVEISRQLAANGMACLCTELPPAGDSYDMPAAGGHPSGIFDRYAFYLDKIFAHLSGRYAIDKVYIGSISVGCLPVLHYCRQKKFAGAVLLSPNHFGSKAPAVNRRNVKTYIYKSLQPATWKKVFTLKVNYRRVFHNMLPGGHKKRPVKLPAGASAPLPEVRVLCLFGEKDEALKSAQEYWLSASREWQQGNYEEVVVPGADHSFFGWTFKTNVCDHIVKWIQR